MQNRGDKKPEKFVPDDWTRHFCATVQYLTQVHRIQSNKYFAGQVGLSPSYLSHILALRRNFPLKHRSQAETILTKLCNEVDSEVNGTESNPGEIPMFKGLLAMNEKLTLEIAYLRDRLADKDLVIKAQQILIERFCVDILL